MNIGTLNESPLHQSLKELYGDEHGQLEVAVEGYIADVVGSNNTLYEIQTAGFGSLKRKLASLLTSYRVVLVHPIAAQKFIVKLPDGEDQQVIRRKSPKKGSLNDVLDQLVSIPGFLNHPNFELEVVMTVEEELRIYDPDVRRRNGWRVAQRSLTEVLGRRRFRNARDLFSLVPEPLPDAFTTADLASAMSAGRDLAQKLAYCLREAGEIQICGKTGNSLIYERCG
ncbi:MAG: hypothetical protein O3A63_10570 [Proteobacteria bacterium]|nr:hypothetical protein [Pseudomonadota bacterium]